MKIKIAGYTTITGTPEIILRVMHDARFMPRPDGDGYIETIREEAKRLREIDLQVEGDSYEERAESLLREMNRTGMITIEEEN